MKSSFSDALNLNDIFQGRILYMKIEFVLSQLRSCFQMKFRRLSAGTQ